MKVEVKKIESFAPKGGYCGCKLCQAGTLLNRPEIIDIHTHKPLKPLYRICPYADPLKWVCKCGQYFQSSPYGQGYRKTEGYNCGAGWHTTLKEAAHCGNHFEYTNV